MMEYLSDQELATRTAAGDLDAFALLYNRYKKPLLNYLCKYLADYHAAEDAFQEAFNSVYRLLRTERYTEKGNLSAWLYMIATHSANKIMRKQKRKRLEFTLDRPFGEHSDESALDHVRDTAPGADEKLQADDRRKLLLRILAKLPGNYRKAILLHEVEGMSCKDVAKALSVPVGFVCVWLQRGKRMLYAMKAKGMLRPYFDR